MSYGSCSMEQNYTLVEKQDMNQISNKQKYNCKLRKNTLKDRNMVSENTYQKMLAKLVGIRDFSEEVSNELNTNGWRVSHVKSREDCFRHTKQHERWPRGTRKHRG